MTRDTCVSGRGRLVTYADKSVRSALLELLASETRRLGLAGMSLLEFFRAAVWRTTRQQRNVLRALDDKSNRTIAVGAGHGVGKTWLAGRIVVAWLVTAPVLQTSALAAPTHTVLCPVLAPTWRQVTHQLWPHVLSATTELERRFGMRMDIWKTSVRLGTDREARCFSTNDPTRLQGWHAPRVRILVDEANGLDERLWPAIRACMTGNDSQLLALGNTIEPTGEFWNILESTELPCEATGVAKLRVSSRQHPNVRARRELIPGAVTQEWITEFERTYRHTPELIRARIDAIFPSASDYALLAVADCEAMRSVSVATSGPDVFSVDVARFGSANTVVTHIAGQRLVNQIAWRGVSLTDTADRIQKFVRGTAHVVVDDDGVGGGVTDTLRARGLPVVDFHGGMLPSDYANGRATGSERVYANAISEAYLRTRELMLNKVLSGEPDERLIRELTTRRFKFRADGRLMIEPKDKYMERTGLPSPDFADSFVMGVWLVDRVWRSGGGVDTPIGNVLS